MTLKQQIKDFLIAHPWARERRARARAIWLLLGKDTLTERNFAACLPEIDSISRYIRMIQMENPSLQGIDYLDKGALEAQFLKKEGWEPGYYKQIKQGARL